MTTQYQSILGFSTTDQLIQQTRMAVLVRAQAFIVEVVTTPNHANRLAWAQSVVADADGMARRVLELVLASPTVIVLPPANVLTSATDSAVQGIVDPICVGLAGG